MALKSLAVSFETREVRAASFFWSELLGREALPDGNAAILPGDATQVGLRFVPGRTARAEWNRLHLHVTSATVDEQRRAVDDVLRLGGRRRGSGALPFGEDVYMNDPSGDEFCLIAPDNAFLAGCGPLGEVTCGGSPETGRFWLEALEWALVWDRDGEIAIQSPAGGTKLSWDGLPPSDPAGWNRQRFVLHTDDVRTEADRLRRIGGTPLRDGADGLLMADPDGSEFLLRHHRVG